MDLRRAAVGTAVAISIFSSLSGASASAPALPNLLPIPGDIVLDQADPGTGTAAIRIEAVVANRGAAHLDLLGVADQNSTERATAYQCVAWASDRVCDKREKVGDFIWHPDHQHHHFEGFASYELRRLDKRARPKMGPKGLAAGGEKVSFCLIDYEEDSDSPSGIGFIPGTGGWPGYSTCLVGSGSQGISRGWRDVYVAATRGQQIVVDNVKPGIYALVISIDPLERLHETDETDNVLIYKISLDAAGLSELCIYSADLKRCTPRKQ